MSEKPRGLTVLALLLMILGIVAVVGGITVPLFLTTGFARLGFFGSGLGRGGLQDPRILVAVAGVVYVIGGIGLWTLKNWGRLLTIVVTVLLLLVGVILIIAGYLVIYTAIAEVIGLVVGGVIVWYLTRDYVKSYFS
jgi:hypothetical protein